MGMLGGGRDRMLELEYRGFVEVVRCNFHWV